jgi:hypothetical protein
VSDLKAIGDLHEELGDLLLRAKQDNPVIVSRQTLRTALTRFVAGEIDRNDLVAWANLIEAHDLVRYELGLETSIADVVFCIASPEINGPLNADLCRQYISQLSD